MTEKKKYKVAPVLLDPAAIEAERLAKAALAEERRLEQERLQRYQNSLPKMSFRQIRGELRRAVKKSLDPWSIVSLIVLENTQTKENPFAKLGSYPR